MADPTIFGCPRPTLSSQLLEDILTNPNRDGRSAAVATASATKTTATEAAAATTTTTSASERGRDNESAFGGGTDDLIDLVMGFGDARKRPPPAKSSAAPRPPPPPQPKQQHASGENRSARAASPIVEMPEADDMDRLILPSQGRRS